MKKNRYALALALALASCSTTKYVGDGSYLLTKVTIQVDSLDQTEREQLGDLESFLPQRPNTKLLGLFDWTLGLYSLSNPKSNSFLNRQLRKWGDPPVLYALEQLGISYEQVSRTPQSGQRSYESLTREEGEATPLWINATPIGLHEGECLPLPYEALGESHLCYDLIYNPSPTTFLRRALQSGARAKDGLEMLHLQADKAWQLWTANEEE